MPENVRFRQAWTEHTCRNGLRTVIIHKPGFSTGGAILITPFGSLDSVQTDESGNRYESPLGTAHYLEHQLFESDSSDVMRLFSSIGANVNAFTSYDATAYYFSTGDPDVEKPVGMLLDFVQSLAVTDASVEKERPIILEEYAMYQQDPDGRMFQECMRGMFHSHPIREDIVGNEESILRITREDLELAYQRNYHPSVMTLIIVSAKPAEELIEAVENNQQGKQFQNGKRYFRKDWREDSIPESEYSEIRMDVQSLKSAVSYKLPVNWTTAKERYETEWALRFALDSWFTPMNPLYQKWIDEEKITPYFTFDVECAIDHGYVSFQDETGECDGLLDFVSSQLNSLKHAGTKEKEILQMKRRTIGTNIRLFDYPSDLMTAWARSRIADVSLFEEIELIERLNADKCTNMIRGLNISRPSCTKLVSR